MKTVEIYLSGIVQGVGFRYYTKQVAKELSVKGYVKNLADGRVYIIAVGDDAMLDKFVSAIKKGPRLAVVKSVEIREIQSAEEFKNFEIRY